MKQACYRPRRADGALSALLLVVALLCATCVLGGCRFGQQATADNATTTASAPAGTSASAPAAPAATPAPTTASAPAPAPAPAATTPAPVDRTQTGSAPGQLNVDGGNSVIAKAMGKGFEEKCREQIRQVRQAIQMNRTDDGKYPASLDAISEINQIKTCPTSHQPYVYNPETGEVHCPFKGHEKL